MFSASPFAELIDAPGSVPNYSALPPPTDSIILRPPAGTEAAARGDVATLLQPVEPAQWYEGCLEVLRRFQEDHALFAVPVVREERPIGLVDRNEMIETFSRPYARELHCKKSIAEFVRYPSMVIERDCRIDNLVSHIGATQLPHASAGFIVTDQGRYLGIGSIQHLLQKVTEHQQERLYRLAHFDALTGLPNRLFFMDSLRQSCALAARNGSKSALLFLDLDGFKYINDTLGHAAGDFLLREISHRLRDSLRESDTLARLGGDEFTVILNGLHKAREAGWVAEKLLQRITEPVHYQEDELFVSASIGIAIYPDDDTSVTQLVKKADLAMYQTKENGKHNYHFFSDQLNRKMEERVAIERDLRKALERDELFLVYQPIFPADSDPDCPRSPALVETLLRWRHPRRGIIGPSEFIPIAEESRLIDAVGEWVLSRLCTQIAAWRDEERPLPLFSVNISMRQFHDPGFCRLLHGMLESHRIPPEALVLELTEAAVMKHPRRVEETLQRLKGLGIKIAVDDFGTGYSSLSYLHKLPLDMLKIDASFIREMGRSPQSAKITAAIVELGHSLALTVIAEGVESREQMETLRRFGCDSIQGFLFAAPMDRLALEHLLTAGMQQ